MLSVRCPECNEKDYIEEDGEEVTCSCGTIYSVDIFVSTLYTPEE